MDEEEIDLWYEEQKEKLTEKYRKNIEKSKNPEKLKKKYESSIHSLHNKYEKLSDKTIKFNLHRFFFKHRLNMLIKKITAPFNSVAEKLKDNKKQKTE
jgi:hypothetical protein